MDIESKLTDYSNVPTSVRNKLGRNIHNLNNHPIKICKEYIYKYFKSLSENDSYEQYQKVFWHAIDNVNEDEIKKQEEKLLAQ